MIRHPDVLPLPFQFRARSVPVQFHGYIDDGAAAYWFRAFHEQERASRVHSPNLPAGGLSEPTDSDLFSIDRLLADADTIENEACPSLRAMQENNPLDPEDRFLIGGCGEHEDEDGNLIPARPGHPTFGCVSVYLCDLAYGGPEEGGWWFDYGVPCTDEPELAAKLMVFTSKRDAYEYREQLQKYLDEHFNAGRRPVSSVLSEGEYRAIVDVGHYPQPYPAQPPHYE